MSSKLQPLVLFCDYNQYWCPLGNLYWSQASKVLVSRHMNSSLEEIISTFCPQCLTRYSEDEASTYLGRCPSCHQCPCCESTLTHLTNEKNSFILQCATCMWRSDESHISGVTKNALDALILQHEKEGIAKKAFDLILSKHQKAESNMKARALINNTNGNLMSREVFSSSSSSSNAAKGATWQLKDLEAHLEETTRRYQAPEKYAFEEFVPELRRLEEEQRVAVSAVQSASEMACTAQQQHANLHSSPRPVLMRTELRPNRVQMRTKRTLRSLRDVDASGRMRLLVQSKVFPTEGDSSDRMVRGKWWAIDCSAVHWIPFVSILRLPAAKALLLASSRERNEYAYLEISIINALEADIVWSFNEQEEREEGEAPSSQQQPYYLLNQFDKPVDTSQHILLCTAPLPEQMTTDSESPSSGCRQLSVPIGSFEDELLKDADDDLPAPVNAPETVLAPGQISEGPAWTVRVDQNIAFIRIPVRVADLSVLSNDKDIVQRFELKLNITMTQGNEASFNRDDLVCTLRRSTVQWSACQNCSLPE